MRRCRPKLEEDPRRGRYGRLAVGPVEAVIEQVNNLVEAHELAALACDPVSLAPLFAVLLGPSAAELLVTWRAEARIQSPAAAFASGPFSRLGPADRLRARRLLEVRPRSTGSPESTGRRPRSGSRRSSPAALSGRI